MPIYRLCLWSADLSRFVRCEIAGETPASLLERFEEAGRCALKLAAIGQRQPALRLGAGGWVRAA
jgi:hypothetical protein